MPALKKTASIKPLPLISAEDARQLPICGFQTFGNCAPRLGAHAEDFTHDPDAFRMMAETDRLLAENEAAVGLMIHREQLGWVFRQLVRTADAIGVPATDERAVYVLNERVKGDELAQAMLMVIMAFMLMQRDAAEDERLSRDPLPEAIERARALNSRRKYSSTMDKAQESLLREIFTLTQGRASSPLQAA